MIRDKEKDYLPPTCLLRSLPATTMPTRTLSKNGTFDLSFAAEGHEANIQRIVRSFFYFVVVYCYL